MDLNTQILLKWIFGSISAMCGLVALIFGLFIILPEKGIRVNLISAKDLSDFPYLAMRECCHYF